MAAIVVRCSSPVYIAVRHCLRQAVGNAAPNDAAAFGRYAPGMMQPEQKSISTFIKNRSSIPYNPLPARLYTAKIKDTDKAEQIARRVRFFADISKSSEETAAADSFGSVPVTALIPTERIISNSV